RDGDPVIAVIRGTAVNQDGASNGLTAPNSLSQQAVVTRALENAGIDPGRVGYVETHGTGTALGDPIEVEALAAVVGANGTGDRSCVLGSIKTNLGHLEAAAGIAGLIKAALCLQRQYIPGNLHFETLNPHISLDNTRFAIPTKGQPWISPDGKPRVAGVSSFGFGGTNAHIVLEERPEPERPVESESGEAQLLVLSARSPDALRAVTDEYVAFLRDPQRGGSSSLVDLAHSAALRRTIHRFRKAISGSSHEAWAHLLEEG